MYYGLYDEYTSIDADRKDRRFSASTVRVESRPEQVSVVIIEIIEIVRITATMAMIIITVMIIFKKRN